MRRKPISAAAAVALLALLPCAAGADAAAAAAAADGQPGPAVFNPMMGSWRRAPTTFDDPKLGTFRAVNNSAVPGLDHIGVSLRYVTMKPCTAQSPGWHPNADEFIYALKGDGLQYNVVWNGSLFTSALREGDLLVVPQGLLHSLLNPTCGDVEVLALYNSPAPVKEAAVPALLAMPPAKGYMDEGGFGEFMLAGPNPPTSAIYSLGSNCSQLCAADASAAPAADGGGYNRFTASLADAPVASENEHGSHRVLTAAQLPALGEVRPGASFSYTTVKSCSFPAPHFMPHANKLTLPVAGAVNVSVLVNGTDKYSHELGGTGDFFVLPKSDLFSLSNELCRDARIVAYWDSPDAAKTYPLSDLALLPEDQLAGAFGVEGSPQLEPATPGPFWPFARPACSDRCARRG